MTEYLSLEDVLTLVDDLCVGPLQDVGLLDSAVHRPRVTVFGRDAYPDVDSKAAVLLESVVRHHALVDGDKRLGWLAVVVFYGLNDIILNAPDDDAYDLVIAMAGGTVTYEQAASAWPNGTDGSDRSARPAGRDDSAAARSDLLGVLACRC